MEKGKSTKSEKYLSIMFIPHSPGKVNVMKLAFSRSRLVGLSSLFLTVLIVFSVLVGYTLHRNSDLKKSISEFSDLSMEQQKIIQQKSTEIYDLKKKEEDIDKKVKAFTDKYREITDNYITNRTGSQKTNRSGDRTDRSFLDDAKVLKGLLDNIGEQKSSLGEAFKALSETESKLLDYSESVPTLTPTSGRISSKFGGRRDPFHFANRLHEGIDIAAPYGQSIKASGSGKVIYSGWYSGYGKVIIIDHGHGTKTVYGHCSVLVAKKDQSVKKGDLIAKVGSSGRSTGAHLHFEIRLNDDPVDPFKYLEMNENN